MNKGEYIKQNEGNRIVKILECNEKTFRGIILEGRGECGIITGNKSEYHHVKKIIITQKCKGCDGACENCE